MDKKSSFNLVITYCEQKFNRGNAELWKHGDYLDLGDEIFRKSKIKISTNTLKRIFGKIDVANHYQPQESTLKALKIYCDFDQVEVESETNSSKENKKRWPALFLVVTAIALVVSIFWLLYSPKAQANIWIEAKEGTLPSTVYFGVERSNFSDSLSLDFGDKSDVVYLSEDQKSIGHNYLFPGVFNVKVKHGQETVASKKVSILSDEWVALAFNKQSNIPNSFYELPIRKDDSAGFFHIPNEDLYKRGIDTSGLLYTRICNYRDTKHLNDFMYECVFKNHIDLTDISCNGVQMQIAGEHSYIRFKFVNNGCSYRVINVVSEKVYDGEVVNQAKFTANLQEWNKVKIINENNEASLYLNDELILKETYSKPLGEIKGTFVEFEGNGYVQSIHLSTLTGKSLFRF